MKNNKFKDFAKDAAGVTKIFLLLFMMTMGFAFTYMLAWIALGWPQTDWAVFVIFGLAVLSEFGYYQWVK